MAAPSEPSEYSQRHLLGIEGLSPGEITALLESYLEDGALSVQQMGRGYAWLDTGTHASLLDAGNFVRTLSERQGQQVGCPEEIAYEAGWIDRAGLLARAEIFRKTEYGRYLQRLAK